MWDLTIHPSSGPNIFIDTQLLFTTDVGSHNPPPSEPSVLTGALSSLPSMWDPPIQFTPPSRPIIHVHPLRVSASSLAHCPVSGSNTIYNNSSPPLADIVLFRLPISGFSSMFFLKRPLGRGFHTLIKNVSFFSPTDVESHTYSIKHTLNHIKSVQSSNNANNSDN